MITAEFILLVLLSLHPYYTDKETKEERTARMTTVANAIDTASSRATCTEPYTQDECKPIWTGSKRQLALLLVTKAWWESRLAKHIHEGNCGPTECDATRVGNVIVHKARTIWQMQRTGLLKEWEWDNMDGTDYKSTRTAAWAATRILARGKRKCQHPHGVLSYYATSRCRWSGAGKRYLFFTKLSKKTREQLEQEADRLFTAKDKGRTPPPSGGVKGKQFSQNLLPPRREHHSLSPHSSE